MKPAAKTAFAMTALAAFLLLAACGERNHGPAEQAGETVDEAAEDAANEAQDATEEGR